MHLAPRAVTWDGSYRGTYAKYMPTIVCGLSFPLHLRCRGPIVTPMLKDAHTHAHTCTHTHTNTNTHTHAHTHTHTHMHKHTYTNTQTVLSLTHIYRHTQFKELAIFH